MLPRCEILVAWDARSQRTFGLTFGGERWLVGLFFGIYRGNWRTARVGRGLVGLFLGKVGGNCRRRGPRTGRGAAGCRASRRTNPRNWRTAKLDGGQSGFSSDKSGELADGEGGRWLVRLSLGKIRRNCRPRRPDRDKDRERRWGGRSPGSGGAPAAVELVAASRAPALLKLGRESLPGECVVAEPDNVAVFHDAPVPIPGENSVKEPSGVVG